ncbi:MAG TPA: 4a-hydroxytetrahydrobiopterin dehydratase [Polyangia bacterium]|jgi:4a-hydroxytetrahydrobiopterin dehydratase|nr:4a-hydroxytetrahydrobiopterin dehydratase [Polyangia bacterium]
MTKLTEKRCVPCEGGTPPLDDAATSLLLGEVDGWRRADAPSSERAGKNEPRISKQFRFEDFLGAMAFLNKMAAIAEAEGHHPDFCVHYNRVDVTLWTHSVGGLSENDFIVAAKVDAMLQKLSSGGAD